MGCEIFLVKKLIIQTNTVILSNINENTKEIYH